MLLHCLLDCLVCSERSAFILICSSVCNVSFFLDVYRIFSLSLILNNLWCPLVLFSSCLLCLVFIELLGSIFALLPSLKQLEKKTKPRNSKVSFPASPWSVKWTWSLWTTSENYYLEMFWNFACPVLFRLYSICSFGTHCLHTVLDQRICSEVLNHYSYRLQRI